MRTASMRWTVGLAMVLVTANCGLGDIRVAPAFGDHMVLQRGMAVPIWGTAAAGQKVTVTFAGQTKTATADKDGTWTLRLDPLKASAEGRPLVVTSSSDNRQSTINDILVGEVWVGSGQSNMAGGTGGYARRDEVLAGMVKAAPYPKLRLYKRGWKEATAANINGFSALLFSFGQPLQKALGVPVGLIVGAVGGTPSGRWLSPQMLAADAACQAALKKAGIGSLDDQKARYAEALAKWQQAVKAAKAAGKRPPRRPRGPIRVGDLYAAHIAPVVPYGIRGVLWDQGESGTAVRAIDQFTMMGALIKGWRTAWGQGEFPFLYVQKPSGGGCAWDTRDPVTRMANPFSDQPARPNRAADGMYRHHHVRIARHPKTAMVTASDLGSGVHPVNKSGYGKRACRVALGFVYGRTVEIYGPVYASHKVQGSTVRVSFTHVGKGLAFRHGQKLQGFEIAGDDGAYHWADAKIDGQTVVLTSDKVARPVNARYGWSTRSRTWANLFNKDGLPALTFRTDK